jgi:hypothetical protein
MGTDNNNSKKSDLVKERYNGINSREKETKKKERINNKEGNRTWENGDGRRGKTIRN